MERLTIKSKATDEIVELAATDEACDDICGRMYGECGKGCPINEAYKRLAAYEDIGTVEEFAELKQAESEGRIIPKEAHQPSFVKYDAVDIFDQWNDTTGALDKGTSWYCEIQSIIEEVAAMAFGAGAIYQSEASAALSEMGEQE